MRHLGSLYRIAPVVALLAGCAAPSREGRFTPPHSIVGVDDRPIAVVHGDLVRWATTPAARTPLLERLLYGEPAPGRPLLRNPQGLAVHAGRLFVCDQGLPDVVVIDLQTRQRRPFCAFDDRPPCPVAVAVDDDGRVYVADPTRGAVLAYTPDGELDRVLHPDGQSTRQCGGSTSAVTPVTPVPNHEDAAPSASTPGVPASSGDSDAGTGAFRPAALACQDGVLYVADAGEGRVFAVDFDAPAWRAFPPPASSEWPLLSPTGIAIGASGEILVADSLVGVIHRFAPDGAWLGVIGDRGRGPGQFVRVKQIAVTPGGRIAAVDAARQSVLIFDSHGTFAGEIGAVDAAGRRWTLPAGIAVLSSCDWSGPPPQADNILAAEREFLIVSDAMGGPSLTLIELVGRPSAAGSEMNSDVRSYGRK
ncbi:MAG: hypothetical protein C4547_02640 [Phycisphaerales bacterium]|nr:MAG: hypothetical protein C4547_02640 [Phycisphaerales bacterium]